MASETAKTRDFELEARAKAVWRSWCKTLTDVDEAFSTFSETYPGVRPDVFEDNGSRRQRKALDVVAGDVGKLRTLVGGELEVRRIDFAELPELEGLDTDIFSQFETGILSAAFDAVEARTTGPFWATVERSRDVGKNHLHWLGKRGSCALGLSGGTVPDDQLLDKVAYFCKAALWRDGEVVGYLSVRQLTGKRVGFRRTARGLGNCKADALLVRHISTKGYWPKQPFTRADALIRELQPDHFEISTLGAL